VLFSPHLLPRKAEPLLASCSYDMTVRLWDPGSSEAPQQGLWDHHSEFAVGLDWSVLEVRMLALAVTNRACNQCSMRESHWYVFRSAMSGFERLIMPVSRFYKVFMVLAKRSV
jgi:hypothetical protein